VDGALRVGDRIQICGGYDYEPAWLVGQPVGYVTGTVAAFIPGQNDQPAAVVTLDEELVLPGGAGEATGRIGRGRFVVLELGHGGTDWSTPEPRVHIELCAEMPANKHWDDRLQGFWVEPHATWRWDVPPPNRG
jgi:hypothetical protein